MKHRDPESQQNQQAWDQLYLNTPGSVWGKEPIPFVAEFVRELAPQFTAKSNHLDAASGEGRHLPTLLTLPGTVHATDASTSALEKLNQLPGDYRAVQCELEQLPFDDEAIDFAILIDTVETLPNPDDVLQELHRVLKPGGILLCNIPGREDGIASLDMQTAGDDSYYYRGTYFYRFYEESEALQLIERNRFDVRRNEVSTWQEQPHPGFRNYEHSHTSRVFLLAKPA